MPARNWSPRWGRPSSAHRSASCRPCAMPTISRRGSRCCARTIARSSAPPVRRQQGRRLAAGAVCRGAAQAPTQGRRRHDPPAPRASLRAPRQRHQPPCAQGRARPAPDPVPVVKLFNPWVPRHGSRPNSTRMATRCSASPTSASAAPNLARSACPRWRSVRLPFGLGIERDLGFSTTFPLSVWAEWARRAGSIIWAEAALARAATPELTASFRPDPAPSPARTADARRVFAAFPKPVPLHLHQATGPATHKEQTHETRFYPAVPALVSTTNMRTSKEPPDVSDILPTVRKRGVIQPLLVRPNCRT
jgi:hypothetical protein